MKKNLRIISSICFGFVLFVSLLQTAQAEEKSRKGGAQLWSESCARCHNMRSPSERSDKEWSVIVHHMRVRANLTAEESKTILEFLKSAN